MDLVKRLRLSQTNKIALAGSGGKTTLMFQLAREYKGRVILTTSAHLALDQLGEADIHYSVKSIAELPDPKQDIAGKILLFTGSQIEPNRVEGPGEEVLQKLKELAEIWKCPMIIEADGSRQLPIKAPGDHEPPIPDFVDTVVVSVGLSGLGKPLSDKWVHRPELFSQLAGIPIGTEITSHHLGKVICSSRGSLKNIPPGARKILFMNQIDSFPNWRAFYEQLDTFLENYHAVAFAVLEDQMLLEVHERIGGIVLAAGDSTRFGSIKQLLDWNGIPLIQHITRIAQKGGLDPILVVLGADQEGISQVLEGSRVEIIPNPDWEEGQSTSVRAGISALPENIGGTVFLLVDQPFVTADLIKKIRAAHARSQGEIILPKVDDHPANPVLFDRNTFEALLGLEGDIGGRALFDHYSPRAVKWEDERILLDIDTPDDYQRLLAKS
jgi:molybdenum cofactor cytidylyltransferase